MRTRKEIESSGTTPSYLTVELLLDVRELLRDIKIELQKEPKVKVVKNA